MPVMDTTKAGATPLHYSAAKGCLDCVKILVESCSDSGWVYKFGSTSAEVQLVTFSLNRYTE